MIHDFTHKMYQELLWNLIENGYSFFKFNDYAAGTCRNNLHVLLRHDVDRLPGRALKLAQLENKQGVVSTYFFRIKGISFNKKIINQIKKLGHEIGYHYEELTDAKGNYEAAWDQFNKNKALFDLFGGIKSIAMHGRPFSKWNNLELWRHYDYREIGVWLDANRDINWQEYIYLTDTGRCWDSSQNKKDRVVQKHFQEISTIKTTKDLLSLIKTYNGRLVISTHPERWTGNPLSWSFTLIQDLLINQFKKLIRSDGSIPPSHLPAIF